MQSGTNLLRVRDFNQSVVLEAVRVGDGASRVEIAEKTGLTAQTVSNIVRRLLDNGLIVETGVSSFGSGKPRTLLRINPHAQYAVGVLLDRDAVSLVVVGLDGQIIDRNQRVIDPTIGPERIIDQIAASISDLIQHSAIDPTKILGIGVGCPGPMDHPKGIVYEPLDLLGWQEVRLKDALAAKVGYPVSIDNDATVAAIGERWVGGAQGARNFAFIFVGVGVGAGLFIENHLYRGVTTNAGEFGHMTLNANGPACYCGNNGCIEIYCAPKRVVESMYHRIAQGEKTQLVLDHPLTIHDIYQAAIKDDVLARDVLLQSAQMLGAGVVSLVNLLDVNLIVLGGKTLADVGAFYKQEVQRALDTRLITRNALNVRVELSTAGEDVGAVGAAALVLHDIYTPRLDGLRAEV